MERIYEGFEKVSKMRDVYFESCLNGIKVLSILASPACDKLHAKMNSFGWTFYY